MNSRARHDPYDLQIVSVNCARSQTVYYIASTTAIIKVCSFLSLFMKK